MAITLGPFELIRPIAQGGMGEVWYGAHIQDGVPVAIKVITDTRASDPHYLDLFRTEVRAVAWLDHPGIILVLDHGNVSREAAAASEGRLVAGSPYLVMEHLGGGSLAKLQMPQPWSEVSQILVHLLEALAHAHAHRVLHRDLKPNNVLFAGPDDLRPGVRLTDFGIAHPADGTQVEDAVSGTPQYIAPEQVRCQWRRYGPWTDLYAFGCLAWRLVTGAPPFPIRDPDAALRAHLEAPLPPLAPITQVPDGFEQWLASLLVKDPTRRVQRAADARRSLLALSGSPPPLIPTSWRDEMPAPVTSPLRGAGLGLYGLRRVPLVGRDEERDVLWQCLHEVTATGHAQVVLAHGPTGSGKTRLLQWMVGRAHETGAAEIIGVTCGPLDGPTDAMYRMLEHHLRRSPSDFLRFPTAAERFEAVCRLLDQLAGRRTVVLTVDDIQWGHDVLDLVSYLVARQSRQRTAVLVLIAAQDEALAERPWAARTLDDLVPRDSDRRLPIGPLSIHHRTQLLRGLLGLEQTLAATVEARSGGNPQFAVELVGDWVRRGLLLSGPEGFTLRNDLDDALPDDLHQVWAARIHAVLEPLPTSALHYLELAAALGNEVVRVEWRALCRDRRVRQRLVDRLLDHRLAIQTRYGWSFVHGMLRESVIRTAKESGRWPVHNLACASMLRQRGQPEPIRLGRHLLEAGDSSAALDTLLLGLNERTDVAVRTQLALLGRCEAIMRKMRLARSDRRWAEVWLRRARIYLDQGEISEGRQWAERVEDAASAQGWPYLRAQALLTEAQGARRAHDLHECERLLDEVEPLIGQGLELRCRALRTRASMCAARANFDQARVLTKQVRALYQQADQPVPAASCLRTRAVYEMRAGNWKFAAQLLSRALPVYRQTEGHNKGLADCLNVQAEIARHEGRLEDAERGYREAITLYESLGLGDAVIPRLNLGIIHIQREQYREGRRVLEVAKRVLERRDDRTFLSAALLGQVVCAAGLQDWDGFDRLLAEAEWLLHATGFADPDLADLAERAATLAEADGNDTRMRQALAVAAAQWRLLRATDRVKSIEQRLQ